MDMVIREFFLLFLVEDFFFPDVLPLFLLFVDELPVDALLEDVEDEGDQQQDHDLTEGSADSFNCTLRSDLTYISIQDHCVNTELVGQSSDDRLESGR